MFLATTAIEEFWDKSEKITLLGEWCIAGKEKDYFKNKNFPIMPSPWKPAHKIKEAEDYCTQILEELIAPLSENLNSLHNVSYSVQYWRTLIGPWLFYLTGVLYDRFKRIEKSLDMFPDFRTFVLPLKECKLLSYDTKGFFYGSDCDVNDDYYNLKIFSLVLHELCPQNIEEKEFKKILQKKVIKCSWKRMIFSNLLKLIHSTWNCPIVLSDMYHLTPSEMFLIKWKLGFNKVSFIDFHDTSSERKDSAGYRSSYNGALRNEINLKPPSGRFHRLLYEIIPEAIPMCYVEDYNYYNNKNMNKGNAKIVGSAVGWNLNENFKFFAAKAVSQGAKQIVFQHGGGLELPLASPGRSLVKSKDIIYTWGSGPKVENRYKYLPSPHLSRLKNSYRPELNNILFVGAGIPKYHYLFQSVLQPDDMKKYFNDKIQFVQNLAEEARNIILYRPYAHNYGWNEVEEMRNKFPDIRFVLKENPLDLMKRVKLVIIDHPLTAFIEAMTINVPSILFWDHDVFQMSQEALHYLDLLKDANIVFDNPLNAAQKTSEIFRDPLEWWMDSNVQSVRLKFCERYALANDDWLEVWVGELNKML